MRHLVLPTGTCCFVFVLFSKIFTDIFYFVIHSKGKHLVATIAALSLIITNLFVGIVVS